MMRRWSALSASACKELLFLKLCLILCLTSTNGKYRMKRKRTYSMDNTELILVERNNMPNGIALVNPYRVGKHSPSDLVELAKEIQQADSVIRSTACGKLQVIAEQVRFLQAQAQRVLEEAREDQARHHAHCNFKRIPGKVYHLYRKASGETYWSMLSPQEWGKNGPDQVYLGAFRLEHDMSWTPEEKMVERATEIDQLTNLLASGTGARALLDSASMDTQ